MQLNPRVQSLYVSYELRTKFRLGVPIVEYVGFWRGPINGNTTNLVQGSYNKLDSKRACMGNYGAH